MGVLCLDDKKKKAKTAKDKSKRVNLKEWWEEGWGGEWREGVPTSQRQTSHSLKLLRAAQKTETNTEKKTHGAENKSTRTRAHTLDNTQTQIPVKASQFPSSLSLRFSITVCLFSNHTINSKQNSDAA